MYMYTEANKISCILYLVLALYSAEQYTSRPPVTQALLSTRLYLLAWAASLKLGQDAGCVLMTSLAGVRAAWLSFSLK